MKRFIIILPPVILFAIFVFFYKAHVKELEEKQAAAKIVAEKAKVDEDARKKVLQEAADKEAQRQKEERLALIEKQKDEAQNKKEEMYRDILSQTESANASSKKLQAQIIKLQADILAVRAARDKAQAEAMETKLDLEKARVAKGNAEFEIQRFTEMLAKRMEQSQALTTEVIAANAKKR